MTALVMSHVLSSRVASFQKNVVADVINFGRFISITTTTLAVIIANRRQYKRVMEAITEISGSCYI